MIKIFIFFALLFAVAFGWAWLADQPGAIIINLPALGVSLSDIPLSVGALAVLFIIVATIVTWVLVRSIWKSPGAIGGFFSSRKRDKGYKALSQGMIAVGVGDLNLAKKYANSARKLIGREPMTLMLEAQTAQLAGDATKARQSFEAMLDQDDTRALGRRGLYIEAQRRGDADEAMEMAKAATGDGKKTPGWAGSALFDMQTASEDWTGALITLSQNQSNKHITKEQFRRQRAVILTAQAMSLEGEDNSAANMRPLLLEACKLAPGLVAAAVKAADVLNELKETRKASKLLEAAWRIEPHPDLAESYAYLKSGDTALERLKRVRSLYALMPDHLESKIAMARACLDAREWVEARSIVEPLAADHLTPRLCMMMAELEEGENNDFGLVRQWLARAVGAHRDPAWTADGQVSDHWQPTSPLTGKLDAFEWKVPVRELANLAQPLIDVDAAADQKDPSGDDLVLIPAGDALTTEPSDNEPEAVVAEEEAPVLEAEPVEEVKAEEATADVEPVEPVVEEPQDAKPIEVETEEASEVETEAASEERNGKPKEVEFPMPHAPDDPGPKGEPVPKSPEKRFRLF